MELFQGLPSTADPSNIGSLICLCKWWVVRDDSHVVPQDIQPLRALSFHSNNW